MTHEVYPTVGALTRGTRARSYRSCPLPAGGAACGGGLSVVFFSCSACGPPLPAA